MDGTGVLEQLVSGVQGNESKHGRRWEQEKMALGMAQRMAWDREQGREWSREVKGWDASKEIQTGGKREL